MPPRVAYWTSAFEPEMEAVAAEVALLRSHFPRSVAWGLSHRHWARFGWGEGCVHPRLHLLFRLATRLLEPAFEVNHVFGSLGDWFYLQGQRQRPTVLTAAAQSAPVSPDLLGRVDRFVVEHPGGLDELADLGIERERARMILPPVDLRRFAPKPAPAGPFTVLFASSPDRADWLEARGVPALLDAARLRPRMEFHLLWRPWGDALPHVQRWIAERELHNVRLVVGRQRDMAGRYRLAHVCIAPFTDGDRSKPAPNSVIESLACGRPVLVSPVVGLAHLVREEGCGLVCSPQGEALAEYLDRLEVGWDRFSRAARATAELHFGAERFLRAYREVYAEVLPDRRRLARPCASSTGCG